MFLFVWFWAVVDVIVSLCDNWPPPPCSRLHGSLQCCSLLNYYQWVWRDTCCLSLLSLSPSWQPLSNTNTRARARTHADARPVFHLTWICWMLMRQKGRDLYCASVSGANRCFHVHIHAWRELRSNTGTDLHTLMHECTRVLTQTQMLLCGPCKWGCLRFLSLIFLFSHKSCTPNKVIILGLAAPNIINGGERGATQVLRHDAVSILTHADIYSYFSPETGGRRCIQMVRCEWWSVFFPAVVTKGHTCWAGFFLQGGEAHLDINNTYTSVCACVCACFPEHKLFSLNNAGVTVRGL